MDAVRASYTGDYAYAFDDKGRITVPLDWRQAPFETLLYVFPSSESCVKVYPASWLSDVRQKVAKKLSDDPKRKAIEMIASRAQSTTFDPQNRITVKESLRKFAGLEDKDATLVGKFTHFEIWSTEVWKQSDISTLTIEQALKKARI